MPAKLRSNGGRKASNPELKHYTLEEARQFDAELRRYVGKWVALVDDHVVASGDTPAEAMENANKAGYELPVVIRAPLTDEEVIQIL